MTDENQYYGSNFAMCIPQGPFLRDDGKPAVAAIHKPAFLAYMKEKNKMEEFNLMTWAERDQAYLQWLEQHPQPERTWTGNTEVIEIKTPRREPGQ